MADELDGLATDLESQTDFGFALIGWSGSVLVGGAVEHAKRHLDLDTDWTEADSRRAMARIGGFGAGVMVGVAVLGTIVR